MSIPRKPDPYRPRDPRAARLYDETMARYAAIGAAAVPKANTFATVPGHKYSATTPLPDDKRPGRMLARHTFHRTMGADIGTAPPMADGASIGAPAGTPGYASDRPRTVTIENQRWAAISRRYAAMNACDLSDAQQIVRRWLAGDLDAPADSELRIKCARAAADLDEAMALDAKMRGAK